MADYGSELPEGFTLDDPQVQPQEYGAELPAGMVLDDPGRQIEQPLPDAAQSQRIGEELTQDGDISFDNLNPKQQSAADELKKRGRLKSIVSAGVHYLRPTLEGLASAGAAIGGTIAGAPTGPFAPAVGAAAGAGAYTATKQALDRLDEWATLPEEIKAAPPMQQMKQTMEDFRTGLAFEFGGPAVMEIFKHAGRGAAGGFGRIKDIIRKNTPALSEDQISKRASEIITEHRGNIEQYDINLTEAERVSDSILGFRPTIGQKTGDPGLIKLQRGLETKPGIAAELGEAQKAENVSAIQDYLKDQFPGSATIDDVLGELEAQATSLKTQAETGAGVAKKVEASIPTEQPQVTGRKITAAIEEAKAPVLKKEKELWEQVPDIEMDTARTDEAFKSAVEKPSTAQPIAKQMDAIYQQLPKTKEGLQTIDRELGSALSNPAATQTERSVLGKMRKAVESDFDKLGEAATDVGPKYKAAKEYSKTQKFDRFDKGAVGEIAKRGNFFGGKKVPEGKIPGKFMDVDNADQLILAIGKNKAGTVMIGHYADDMANKVSYGEDGVLKSASLSRWYSKNKKVLEKYGIGKDFKTVEQAHKSMQAAQVAETEFNRSIASKMLNADPQNAIQRAFEGGEGISGKNTGAIMKNLLKRVEGNPQAIKGLENGFKNFMFNQIKTTAETLKGDSTLSKATLDKAMKRFAPAQAILYKRQPEKLKALKTVQKALLIMNRTAKGVTGGSDTSEKLNIVASVLHSIARTPGIAHGVKLSQIGLGMLKNLNEQEVTDFTAKLLYDPDLAKIISRATGNNPPVNKIKTELKNYMERAAIYSAREATKEQEKK